MAIGSSYCLPPNLAAKFQDQFAGPEGRENVNKLRGMSSDGRRAYLSGIVGEDHAPDVNALFEQKLLLKNQKAGLLRWVQKLSKVSPEVRKDLTDKIQGMGNILDDESEKTFLRDLARTKLGATVSADEAQTIFTAAQDAQSAKSSWLDLERTQPNSPEAYDARVAYGRKLLDLNDTIESMKPGGRNFTDKLLDAAFTIKTIQTGILHFSAPFVQMWGMVSDARAWQSMGKMFGYFYDEENYNNLMADIATHPLNQYAFSGSRKLGITYLGDKLSTREEAIQGTWLQRLNEYAAEKTGLPINLIGASSRAFTGSLNHLRWKTFVDLYNTAQMAGEDVTVGSKALDDIIKAINDHTGRGAIGTEDTFANTTPLLNAVGYSARKLSATIEMLNPLNFMDTGGFIEKASLGTLEAKNWGTASKTARDFRYRQLFGSLAATGAVMGLFRALGYKIDVNPTSTHFGQVGLPGGTWLDPTGGAAEWMRFVTRLITGHEVTSSGKLVDLTSEYTYKPTTRADLVGQFLRNKTSPAAGIIWDKLSNTMGSGLPFSWTEEARERLAPIWMNGALDYFNSNPKEAGDIIPILTSMFGVGVRAPLPPPERKGMNIFGEPISFGDRYIYPRGPETDALNEVGYNPGFPGPTINGVKLSDDQYTKYLNLSGMFSKTLIGLSINSQGWNNLNKAQKIQQLKNDVNLARTKAQTQIILESGIQAQQQNKPGTDILSQSILNQEKLLQGQEQ